MVKLAFQILSVMLVTSVTISGFAAETDLDGESTIVLEERYQELQDERKSIKAVIRDISPALEILDNIQLALEGAAIKLENADEIIERLKKSIPLLKKLPPETKITRNQPAMEKYRSAYRSLEDIYQNQLEQNFDELQSIFPDEGELTHGEKLIKRIIRRRERAIFSDRTQKDKPLFTLYDAVSYKNESVLRSALSDRINSADDYLNFFTNANISATFNEIKAQFLKFISTLSSELKRELDNRQAKNKKLLTELEEINKALEGKRTKQSIIDQGLIFAVYGMIGVLLLMFLSLRLFSSDVALELVKRRALIEVVGMAFMLITIIILGTGNKINTETLGTLLGTIAGYIFGRIGSDRAENNSQTITNEPNKANAADA